MLKRKKKKNDGGYPSAYVSPDPITLADGAFAIDNDIVSGRNAFNTQIAPGDILDLYVKFNDIYQHLNKQWIYQQVQSALIEEAGEFSLSWSNSKNEKGENVWIPDDEQIEIPRPNPINDSNKEYWQHIRFTMPDSDLILNLRWAERLFEIKLDINHKLFGIVNMKDTQKLKGLIYSGEQETLRQVSFPHKTYSVVNRGTNNNVNDLMKNVVEITAPFVMPSEIKLYNSTDKNSSYYTLDRDPTPLNINRFIQNHTNELKINYYDIYKKNINFVINLRYKHGIILDKQDHQTGSIVLDIGNYEFRVGGASGGKGGSCGRSGGTGGNSYNNNAGRNNDRSYEKCLVVVSKVTTLNYKLGRKGTNGTDGVGSGGLMITAGGGSAGGGGSTILEFDESVIFYNNSEKTQNYGEYKAFYYNGGKGGDGGGWRNANVSNNNISSVSGGSAHYSNLSAPGPGRNGNYGGVGGGTSGQGGNAGIGFNWRSVLIPEKTIVTRRNNLLHGEDNDGYLQIEFIG